MTHAEETLIAQMSERIEELEREVADLKRHNGELREAIEALMQPDKPLPPGSFARRPGS